MKYKMLLFISKFKKKRRVAVEKIFLFIVMRRCCQVA